MLFPTDQPNAAALSGIDQSKPFARLFGHLFAYKGTLLTAATLGFLVTGLGLCFVRPSYEATAVVIVDSRRNKLADAESALSSIVVDQYQSALKSELALIESTDLARHVIASLDLLQTPEYSSALTHEPMAARFETLRAKILAAFGGGSEAKHTALPTADAAAASPSEAAQEAVMQNAVRIFQKSFWAENELKSLTIRMGYRSQSPQLAAAITNAALKRYLDADEEVKKAAIDRSEVWLSGRIAALRADLDAAEHAVEVFRASHDLATFRDRSPLEQELLQLQGRQVDAEADVSAAQAKAKRVAQDGGESLTAGSDTLASRLIQNLRVQEATLLSQQAQMAVTLLPSNPSMIKVADALSKVRGAIRDEINRIGQSNTDDLRQAQVRLTDVTIRVITVQQKIDAANAADIKLRSLEQDAATKRAVLSAFTQRYDQDAGTPLTQPDSRVVSWATVPVDASSPSYGLALVGGTLGFTALAFFLSVGIERLRHGFGGLQELEEDLGMMVAGLTPRLPRRPTARLKQIATGTSPLMRELALTVRALAHTPTASRTCLVLLVTSAVAGEGKSSMALSIARSVAGGGKRCLLVDADIRNPVLHSNLGVPATPGLVDLSLDRVLVTSVVRQVPSEGFDFLPAGRTTPDALAPFTADAFGRYLTEFKHSYDVIVIDSAPALLASEVLVLSGSADLTLFLVKWRTTPREIARKGAVMLSRSSAGPCIAVLAQVDIRRLGRDERRMEEQYRTAYQVS